MKKNDGKLVIVRHHESEWNKSSRWTGKTDVGLTPYGEEMARKMGEVIQDWHIDMAVSSGLKRSIDTLSLMLDKINHRDVVVKKAVEIDERDYGDYAGENKWSMKELFGEERFNCIRREWDCPVPNGETLKMVYERVIPFYTKEILPELQKGKNILLVGHTNSLRALRKYIEDISDEGIHNVEMPFDLFLIYEVDEAGRMKSKEEVRSTEPVLK
jgi:2,3-bisphosphoglycerate-dependent phosphoglycerate mutase